jgi:hypothetical protein
MQGSGHIQLLPADRDCQGNRIVDYHIAAGQNLGEVRNIPLPSKAAAILPPAKDCFKVFFNADNQLEVSPCVRLADGRIFSRQDLTGDRFSSAYYLEGEGFLPTVRLPAEGTFGNPAVQTAMPLFGFLQNEKDQRPAVHRGPKRYPGLSRRQPEAVALCR